MKSNNVRKAGISLVALVITIIVLIVLTGAVVMTGVNAPSNAQFAVFKSNVATVQDAVTMKMLNNMMEYMELNSENAKWIGVAEGYAETDVANTPTFGTQINGVAVVKVDSSVKDNLSISEEELAKYYVDTNGIVYHEGYTYNGVTYYNVNVSNKAVESIEITSMPTKTEYVQGETIDITGLVVKATYSDGSTADVTNGVIYTPTLDTELAVTDTVVTITYEGKTVTVNITVEQVQLALPNPNWTEGSLNATTPYVQEVINGTTYYAPVPLGFTVATGTISEGLVIQDSSANQFVWVPVNDSYTMIGDVTGDGTFNNYQSSSSHNFDIPYLSNDTTTALAYWQASASGHSGTITDVGTFSEPYSSAGSWETAEYQAMTTSVLKYGGFYVGRYETGGSASAPVVKSGVTPITSIMWNSTTTMTDEPTSGTATYVARNMYPSTNTTYGVVSTLIYGIQWDSIMCWAECYNNTRATSTYTSTPSSTGAVYADGTTYDVNKNIYDLAGNVYEWSMEARDSSYRVLRGGYYDSAYAVSHRSSGSSVPLSNYRFIGFRAALYVK